MFRNINAIIFIILTAFAASLCGCSKAPASGDKVLAHVSNTAITVRDFKSRMAKLPNYYQNIARKNLKRYLDDIILEMLFYEAAVRDGVDRDREVKEVLAEAKRKIVIAKFIKNQVEDKFRIPVEEAGQYYEMHKENFRKPPLWRASHILVNSEQEAKEVQGQLAAGAKFEELATKYSTDATASRGGDIGYFKAGQLVPEFETACFKLEIGETSGIVRTQFGYHIIRLTDRAEESTQTFEEARSAIEAELTREKRSELFDTLAKDLKERYGVKIEEDVFKSLETATDPMGPAGVE